MARRGQEVGASSSACEGLPDELSAFLARDTYSLLIKGGSGTGKTTLALTILKALSPIDNLLFLSTKTSPLQLIEDHPWTEEILGRGDSRVGNGEDWSNVEERLIDARLDEPNVVFERITNVLMDRNAPTVVIDSWESLGDALGSEALRTNIRVLESWRERAGARFIFVGEDPANSDIDSMVEGVVLLKDRMNEGRRLREMVLSKLRGVQVSRPEYFFTLQGGAFTSFPGYQPQDYRFRNPVPVELDGPFKWSRGHYPTGYSQLDSFLGGGFPSRSTAVVEVGGDVDPRVGMIFLSRTMQVWLSAGNEVLLQKPQAIEQGFIRQFIRSFARGAGERLRLTEGGRPAARSGIPRAKAKEAVKKRELLSVLSSPERQGEAGSPADRADLTILLGGTEALDKKAGERASTHLRLLEIEGTLFVECRMPWSSLYGVVPEASGGNPMIRLEQVV